LGLKEGEHVYDFTVGDVFMQEHGAPEELKNWAAAVHLRFVKHLSFFQLHFDVSGTVIVPCDRCGDEFLLNLWDEFELIVKLSGEDDKLAERQDEADVAFIPRSETVLDISNWLYEFVMLSVPLHKVHPDDACNPKALQLLNELSVHEDVPGNSVWNGLKNIKIVDDKSAKNEKVKKSK
ncbi:MAG: DUF177 domain-containing protein, partial [Chitinophagaceae bacterium]